jgi:hypothetical protein
MNANFPVDAIVECAFPWSPTVVLNCFRKDPKQLEASLNTNYSSFKLDDQRKQSTPWTTETVELTAKSKTA